MFTTPSSPPHIIAERYGGRIGEHSTTLCPFIRIVSRRYYMGVYGRGTGDEIGLSWKIGSNLTLTTSLVDKH
jgi:hypothetical protein